MKSKLMEQMAEFHIKLFSGTTQLEVIRKLWKKCLYKDTTFHYLLEDGYLLLRFDRKNKKVYENELKTLNLKYEYRDVWRETGWYNTEVVAGNGDFFAQYFHLVSVLSLSKKMEVMALKSIIERMEHCFLDMNKQTNSENVLLMLIAIERSTFIGYLRGREETK